MKNKKMTYITVGLVNLLKLLPGAVANAIIYGSTHNAAACVFGTLAGYFVVKVMDDVKKQEEIDKLKNDNFIKEDCQIIERKVIDKLEESQTVKEISKKISKEESKKNNGLEKYF